MKASELFRCQPLAERLPVLRFFRRTEDASRSCISQWFRMSQRGYTQSAYYVQFHDGPDDMTSRGTANEIAVATSVQVSKASVRKCSLPRADYKQLGSGREVRCRKWPK